MFGSSTPDEFRFFFPRSFIDQSVKDLFNNFMKAMDLPWTDLTDYINSGVVTWDLGGLKDNSDVRQTFDQGRYKLHRGSLPVEEYISKDLTVSMKLMEGGMNWFIMRKQLEEYLKWTRPLEQNFLPPVYLQMMDEEDRIAIQVTYTYIRLVSISDITLSVQDNGIISKEFTVGMTYNEIDFDYPLSKLYDGNANNQ